MGGVHFQKVPFFNYFRHNKSEPDLTDDCICAVFLNFLPNRFRLNMEPHELVCKSVTANLHRNSVSIFKICFQNLRYMEPDFQVFHIPDSNKCVFGPGDVWACPRIYRFISKSENVGQTISDPLYKLIVYITCHQYGSIPFSKMI